MKLPTLCRIVPSVTFCTNKPMFTKSNWGSVQSFTFESPTDENLRYCFGRYIERCKKKRLFFIAPLLHFRKWNLVFSGLCRFYSPPYNLLRFNICNRPNILRILPALVYMHFCPMLCVSKVSEISEIEQPISEKEIENKKIRVGCKIINHYSVKSCTV
jgi:hypothetical protein